MFFWNSLAFFDDPADVGNLISGSSAFSKTSLTTWKFMAHVLLKPGLENFEHYFTRVWSIMVPYLWPHLMLIPSLFKYNKINLIFQNQCSEGLSYLSLNLVTLKYRPMTFEFRENTIKFITLGKDFGVLSVFPLLYLC